MSNAVTRSFSKGPYTYELIWRTCGKKSCGKCPHGPYWYMKIKLRTGKIVQKYVGKSLPEGVNEPKEA